MSSEPIEYIRARTVLLDALEAIGHQREAAILVGAQAVYLHAGAADLAVPPTTTDSDIALSVGELHDEPELARALLAAGFVPGAQPGSWRGRGGVAVDLMVAPHPVRAVEGDRACCEDRGTRAQCRSHLQAVPMAALAGGFERHREEPNAAAVSAETIAYLHAEGRSADGALAELAAAEVMGDTTIAASFAALVEELLTSQIATWRPER